MGHLFRGLNLAEELARSNISFKFYLNNHSPSLEILRKRGLAYHIVQLNDFCSNWETKLIRQDGITLWINDRLDTDARHAKNINLTGVPLATFDDRGTGAQLCDLHIAAMVFTDKGRLGGKKILNGKDYLILNSKIKNFTRIRNKLSSILVTLGGSDTHAVTIKVVKKLKAMNLGATIVVGPAFLHTEELNKLSTVEFKIKKNIPSLIEEFCFHDLAITGGGITPFEANASGLPCLVIANESFEIQVGKKLEKLGGSLFVGHHKSFSLLPLREKMPLLQMSKAGMCEIDLQGTSRVVQALLELIK